MQSNLSAKAEFLEELSEEDLLKLAFPGREMPIEEHRRLRRTLAAKRGKTLEEEMDELERFTGCKEYADALRVLHGILSYEEVWGTPSPCA